MAALLGALAARDATFDVVDLDQIPAGDPLHDAALPPTLTEERQPGDLCLHVPLPATVDELFGTLPHELGPRMARAWRRLRREGAATFELADAGNLEELIDGFFRLHAERWEAEAQPGVLADPALQGFHRDVAAAMLARGRLRLHALRFEGRVAAVLYAFAQGDRLFGYLTGFSPRLAAASPGGVMIWRAMSAAIDEGLRVFDFLRGDEPYKRRWGAEERRNRRRVLRSLATPAGDGPSSPAPAR
jgi:CelD/BcsL family acetyltransferase involved in cellulose biosynthesis